MGHKQRCNLLMSAALVEGLASDGGDSCRHLCRVRE